MSIATLWLTVSSINAVFGQTTVTFQQGVAGYSGTIDTDVDIRFPGAHNFNTIMRSSGTVFSTQPNGDAQMLIRFEDIFGSAAGQIPLGAQIQSATLTLTPIRTGNGGESSAPQGIFRMLSFWPETVTYASIVDGVMADDVEASSTADASGNLGVSDPSAVDVTASLQAWVSGSPNYGWAIIGLDIFDTDDWQVFTSEAGPADAPLLSVTYDAASTPTHTATNTATSTPSPSPTATATSAPGGSCAPSPATCTEGFCKALLLIKEKVVGKEKVVAKFLRGPMVVQGDFGDPLAVGGTSYALCIYNESDVLVGELNVDRPGDSCGSKQCWKSIGKAPPEGKGFRYKDKETTSDGVKILKVKGGDTAKTKLLVKAANNSKRGQLSMPTGIAASLDGDTSATIQLHSSDAQCFSVDLTDIKKAESDFFKAKM